ncbi:MAG: PD-(D/E)XK nuclease family protein [Candidatus Micrarchaeota archaeon]|nr:PD-(D/E)XK nuclease family protein [Candidatus Micrarchaeota archaeon]
MTGNNAPGQTVLERLHKKSISAKDIANQFWCEKQMELNYLHGTKYTPAMDKGQAIHAAMQVEVYKPLTVEPASFSDRMYKTAYENIMTLNTLVEKRMARELKVYGSINGYSLVGQIDELRMEDGSVVVVENKTTESGRLTPKYTKPHQVQAMLYRKMLGEIRSGEYGYRNLDIYYKFAGMQLSEGFRKGLADIGVKPELMGVDTIFMRMFDAIKSMPQLSDSIIINYVSRRTNDHVSDIRLQYDKQGLAGDITYAMGYWTGQRQAVPVPEEDKWKCKLCRFFGKECKVWWT